MNCMHTCMHSAYHDDDICSHCREINFQLHINGESVPDVCTKVDRFDEGVELAIRSRTDDHWVPLRYYASSATPKRASAGEDTNIGAITDFMLSLRGYQVGTVNLTGPTNVTEYICDEAFLQEGVQFRWLQTTFRANINATRDPWLIDNVVITVHSGAGYSTVVLNDDFNGQDDVK